MAGRGLEDEGKETSVSKLGADLASYTEEQQMDFQHWHAALFAQQPDCCLEVQFKKTNVSPLSIGKCSEIGDFPSPGEVGSSFFHTHMHALAHTQTYTHILLHTLIRVYMHTYMHEYIYTHVHLSQRLRPKCRNTVSGLNI